MAEAHPVGLPVGDGGQGARREGHPRRPAVHPDQRAGGHATCRCAPGTDIAFLGGVINYVLQNELDFRDYVVAYTNAAIDRQRRRTSTPRTSTGCSPASTPRRRTYDPTSWQYAGQEQDGDAARQDHEIAAGDRQRAAARDRTAPSVAGRPAARRDAAAPAAASTRSSSGTTPATPRRWSSRPAASPPRRSSRCAQAWTENSRPRPHHRAGLQRRLDPAQRRRAVHPHRRDPPAAAGQHGPPGRRHHGAARARQHPGLDRHPDAVQPAARLPADAATRRTTTSLRGRGSTASATPGQGLLGQRRRLRRQPAQGLLGRRRDARRTTSASTTCPGSPATTAPTARCST